eukprot:scaffold224236_cov20-Prasinocladus_malaysianus.AAC.1
MKVQIKVHHNHVKKANTPCVTSNTSKTKLTPANNQIQVVKIIAEKLVESQDTHTVNQTYNIIVLADAFHQTEWEKVSRDRSCASYSTPYLARHPWRGGSGIRGCSRGGSRRSSGRGRSAHTGPGPPAPKT